MTDLDALQTAFPHAVTFERYLANVTRAVAPLGFDREHTFAAVSVCRDELTQSFVGQVAQRWGQPFNLGGLGALPSLGRTGWSAALAHVPHEDQRGHLLVFGLPHLGIDPDGNLGQSLRRNQYHPTSTCGAMTALLQSLKSGGADPVPAGLDDREAERLYAVMDSFMDDLPRDLVELTKIAASAVDVEMWSELEALQAHTDMEVAVFCGIQVHLPDDVDHIWPVTAAVQGADGVRRSIELPS